MIVLRLALRSLWARRATALLAALSIALGVALLLTVERLREGAKAGFAGTISDTDVIVGARSGGVQLLLYSVFRIGSASNNITWDSYRAIAAHEAVEWSVPLSLGDSHRGYRVIGTTLDYFTRLKVRGGRSLAFAEGRAFADLFDVVLGAEVAERLGYRLGDPVVIAHGLGDAGLSLHDDKPFRVSGVLAPTGTPIDRSLHVSLEAIEAIHVDWRSGARIPGAAIAPDAVRSMDLEPGAITAALVGVKSRLAVFAFQRHVNGYEPEPLTAVLPGVALGELWSVVGVADRALVAISALVIAVALVGMVSMLLAAANERRREMAILRAVGARARTVFALLIAEAAAIAALGAVIGLALHAIALHATSDWLEARHGLVVATSGVGVADLGLLAAVVGVGALCGLPPAIRAYRWSLADGVGVKS